ncbi:hypothetical protein MMC25_001538 [Agyrium rufum]|nr:hypothetical protein [Agyrium rufum]
MADPTISLEVPSHPDTTSDNGDGEKPVREKLKQTSIASMINNDTPTMVEDGHNTSAQAESASNGHKAPIPSISTHELTASDDSNGMSTTRSRPISKRTLADTDEMGHGDANSSAPLHVEHTHTRKKSRDIRGDDFGQYDDKKNNSSKGESIQIIRDDPTTNAPDTNDPALSTTPKTSSPSPGDSEMQDQLTSPRRKRSRDQFEQESQREQKIAATDETKSRRRSQELEREASDTDNDVVKDSDPESTAEGGEKKSSTNGLPPSSGFSNTSAQSPFGALASKPSTQNEASQPSDTTQDMTTSSDAFASSGFAVMAKSSTSPFGALAGSPPPDSKPASSPFGALTSPSSNIQTNNGSFLTSGPKLSSFASPNVPAKENSPPATFASSSGTGFSGLSGSSSGFGSLGGSAFGSTFNGGFSSGSKLSSFAAPIGDTKLGKPAPKAFGASADNEEDDEEGSEGASVDHDAPKVDPEIETDHRFQKQEMETGEEGENTIIQVRGKLFQWVDTAWAERGIGPFKLNITRPKPASTEGEKEGKEETEKPKIIARFLMRAQLTHRVILNSPIFENMLVTDAGNGKFRFSGMVDGKIVPYLLRIKKEDEFQKLLQSVKKVQQQL